MAKQFEDLRARGLLDSYTADEAVGIAVNQLMFERRITRKQLGEALGIAAPNAGKKLRGEIGWSLTDLFTVAEFLGVEAASLLPRKAEGPDQQMLAGAPIVAGTGFEPVTSGL
jgi:transcriptional regulator with XRE-family HTH domain